MNKEDGKSLLVVILIIIIVVAIGTVAYKIVTNIQNKK